MIFKAISIRKILAATLVLAANILVLGGLSSCGDSKSYAELLTEETHYVNNYLADQRVTNTMPTDTTFVFEVGEDAPYYRLDEDGNVYMQVVKYGTAGNFAEDDQVIYFRFTRYALSSYEGGELTVSDSNEHDMTYLNSWFRFNNLSLQSSYQWGSGLQMPLRYLPIDSEVNIVIKSQYGWYDEQAYVQPFLYTVRYYPQQT